ncbi:sulfite exporter TauE/SafE domain protein, partial [Bordetella holmesii H620]
MPFFCLGLRFFISTKRCASPGRRPMVLAAPRQLSHRREPWCWAWSAAPWA